jgi:hypothetical protein
VVPSRSASYNIRVSGYVDTEAEGGSHPDHVTVEGVDASSFGIFNVDTATFKNMDAGPGTTGAGCGIVEGPGIENKIGFAGSSTYVPRNVVVDGLFIHNQNRNQAGADSDCHTGGLLFVTGDGVTLRNTVFSQNAVYDIEIQNYVGPPATNVTFENNWFGCPVNWLYAPAGETTCNGQADVQFSAASGFSNWLIRFNSFGAGLGQYTDGEVYSNVRVVGNSGSGPSQSICQPGIAYAYNAWYGSQCAGASNEKMLGTMPFASMQPGGENFRLVSGSPAINAVIPTSSDYSLGSDIAGQSRPLGTARDAGSTEVG